MAIEKRLGLEPVEPNDQLFIGFIKGTLMNALERGGEWGSPALIDKVLDFYNEFGKPDEKATNE